ncbi:hypothetical protein Bbelb_160350 [Branchiostoma belcheri]|nr:hypothetical protein Bbelb_160350 [Branchiostoma belcheri]
MDTVKGHLLNKDVVRASDLRLALLVLYQQLKEISEVSDQTLKLIETLANMQQLCYADAEERSITSVFRMTNQIVLQHLLMKECLPGPPKTMTTRKLWGHYMHSLRDHIPIVFRIVATSSTMAENEERQFSSLKRITKSSANYSKPGHIIKNLFVRTHYQQKLQPSSSNHQINKISQAAKAIPKERTRIPINLLKKYPRDAQTYCERISDFLLPGYGVHWHIEEDHVVLHDAPDDKPNSVHGPKLHHFRSTTLKKEHAYLQQKWQECIQKQVPMPLSILWVYEGQKLIKKFKTPYLDPGYSFEPQVHHNLPFCQDGEDEVDEEERRCEPEAEGTESGAEDDTVVVRMERLDPEPDLEEGILCYIHTIPRLQHTRHTRQDTFKGSGCFCANSSISTPARSSSISTPASSSSISTPASSSSISTPARSSSISTPASSSSISTPASSSSISTPASSSSISTPARSSSISTPASSSSISTPASSSSISTPASSSSISTPARSSSISTPASSSSISTPASSSSTMLNTDIPTPPNTPILFFASSEENYVSRVLGLVMGGLGGNVTVQRKVEPRMTLTRRDNMTGRERMMMRRENLGRTGWANLSMINVKYWSNGTDELQICLSQKFKYTRWFSPDWSDEPHSISPRSTRMAATAGYASLNQGHDETDSTTKQSGHAGSYIKLGGEKSSVPHAVIHAGVP